MAHPSNARIPAHKARRNLCLPRALWARLDALAHAAGRPPGQQLEVMVRCYLAALASGAPIGVDATDALSRRSSRSTGR